MAAPATADPRLLDRLNDDQRRVYDDWWRARSVYDKRHDAYWAAIGARRAERGRKIGVGETVTAADFVMQHPPKYAGPALRPDIAKVVAEFEPPKPEADIASVAEMLKAARQHYKF